MKGPDGIELFHGYTYSAHPTACAAGLATLDIYEREGLLTRAKTLAKYWEEAAHSLRGLPHVIDVRNYGLILGLEFEPIPGKPGARAFEVFTKCFERGLLVRQTADIIALSPPLIIEQGRSSRFSRLSRRYCAGSSTRARRRARSCTETSGVALVAAAAHAREHHAGEHRDDDRAADQNLHV